MDWDAIVKTALSTATVVAAIAWFARYVFAEAGKLNLAHYKAVLKAEHDREMEAIRNDNATELEELRSAQQAALAALQASAAERLAAVASTLARVERLEAALARHRGTGYGDVWPLTGTLNLFGPQAPVDAAKLAASLKDWYFKDGWVLTEESKQRYFLVQEALGLIAIRTAAIARPSDTVLLGGPERPVAVLRGLRTQWLGVDDRGNPGAYTVAELGAALDRWKAAAPVQSAEAAQMNWVLLQWLLSAFRSGMVAELDSRRGLAPAAASAGHA